MASLAESLLSGLYNKNYDVINTVLFASKDVFYRDLLGSERCRNFEIEATGCWENDKSYSLLLDLDPILQKYFGIKFYATPEFNQSNQSRDFASLIGQFQCRVKVYSEIFEGLVPVS